MSGRRRAPRNLPLRTRLALTASAAVALVALGVCVAAFFVIRYELYHQLDLNLTQSATLAIQQNRDAGAGVLAGECRYLSAPACSQIVPASAAKDPATAYLLPVGSATREVAAGDRAPYYTNITLYGHPTRMLTTPIGKDRALQVALRADPVERGVHQAAWLLAAIGAAGALLAAALGYWVSRTGLAPVVRLTATAEHITATRDPRHRIEPTPDRHDEITRLTSSFNTMLDELERSVTAQRRLVADASHELRTPLTALRTNAELLARSERLTEAQRARASTALARQIAEVTSLVNDLIELARDEEPTPLLETVRLSPLVDHTVGTARGHWPEITFTVRTEADPALPGVPARLSRLLANLLSNAAKFSPPYGTVEVTLTATELTVRDHGPGIAAQDLPHVFDRFYRAEAARALPGSGLGLALARQIARAHGADLTAEQAPDGGALFRLTLPDPPPGPPTLSPC
ncbi:HAMP domain-containing sensor histidine kinase [Streptomyces beijiangensis]|uniref:histidine kinase n=1 Tax=Streptomyces beijiangensis TaxID=163361 RepID=A0A939FA09_9ACTN|nr:HAMP domain-containing sensor histidine kinase [Streptomyces beijiangensis]MBO0514481.1 HAMP domain-containing histidine kinase [Streptomyces beijiangensis]